MLSSKVRQAFIDFFKSKGHTFVQSSPVVPQNDPTLLFINAGMNQFKDVFLGQGKRDYSRAVNSQVCIRVSGKHNDLEEVGRDTHHQTLFEMLGNWSFGDYYKKEAISWAWELLSEVYKLPKDKMYASYHYSDKESAQIWQNNTDINPDHILEFGDKDNFWEMAETGPCGPCSEIHLDRGPQVCDQQNDPNHKCQVNGDCARYIELWNLVFIQYNKQSDNSLQDLPQKHVDTGAGLERITAYLQKTTSNFETDLFQPIIAKIQEITGTTYKNDISGMPHRVMADHIRTLTFAIADNVVPSNEGRGYVLRRILRRGLRYAKKLGHNEPILNKLVSQVVQIMGNHYPHLKERQEFIQKLIKAEEESFLRTLDSGLNVFEEVTKNKTIISGKDAFKLYDTYGFPIDLTQMLAKEQGLEIDEASFEQELELQRERSRKHVKLHNADDERASRGGEARVVESDEDRIKLARHHTATHLLQSALRQVLGTHVNQAGSLVDLDHLRFDFSHFSQLTKQELAKVESIVNDIIKSDQKVEISHQELAAAKEMGALALFGEKYEDQVRVVKVGDSSIELCGGNHVSSTGVIEDFHIINETAISAGTRRIVAIAGYENIAKHSNEKTSKEIVEIKKKLEKAKKLNLKLDKSFYELESFSLEELKKKSQELSDHIKKAEKEIAKQKSQEASSNLAQLLTEVEKLEKYSVFIKKFNNYDLPTLRNLTDNIVNSHKGELIAITASDFQGKGMIFVKTSASVDLSAKELIQKLTSITGGGGGGNETKAQAGGADASKLDDALAQIKKEICES